MCSLLPQDTDVRRLNKSCFAWLELRVSVIFYYLLVCVYTILIKYPLFRFSSLRPSPAPTNPYSLTSAQPTTQTTRLPFPSRNPRQLCPASPCMNNRWKRGRRGRRSEGKQEKRWRRSRGRSLWGRGRQVTKRKPRVRARHVWCAARVATLTPSSRRGGWDTHCQFRRGELTVAATNPGPLTWGNHTQVSVPSEFFRVSVRNMSTHFGNGRSVVSLPARLTQMR